MSKEEKEELAQENIARMTNQARNAFQALENRSVGSLEEDGTPVHPSIRHIQVNGSIDEINKINKEMGKKGTVGYEVLNQDEKETREAMSGRFKDALVNGYTVDAQEKFQEFGKKLDDIKKGVKSESRESLGSLSKKIIDGLNSVNKAASGDLGLYSQAQRKPLKDSDYAALDPEGKSGLNPSKIKEMVESFAAKAEQEKSESRSKPVDKEPVRPEVTPSIPSVPSGRRGLPNGRHN